MIDIASPKDQQVSKIALGKPNLDLLSNQCRSSFIQKLLYVAELE